MACGVNRSDQVVPGVDGCRVRFGARYVAVAELPAVVGVVVQDARSSVASTVAPGHDVLFGTAGRRPDPRLQREPLRPCAWCKSGERVRQESAGSRVAAQDAIEPDRPVSSERSRLVESWCRPSAQLAVVPARFGACRGKTPVRNRPVAHDGGAIAATARARRCCRASRRSCVRRNRPVLTHIPGDGYPTRLAHGRCCSPGSLHRVRGVHADVRLRDHGSAHHPARRHNDTRDRERGEKRQKTAAETFGHRSLRTRTRDRIPVGSYAPVRYRRIHCSFSSSLRRSNRTSSGVTGGSMPSDRRTRAAVAGGS